MIRPDGTQELIEQGGIPPEGGDIVISSQSLLVNPNGQGASTFTIELTVATKNALQQVGNNTAAIAANTSNIATNTADIATNTKNIATNTGDISALTITVTQNSGDIADNSTAITALQAAIVKCLTSVPLATATTLGGILAGGKASGYTYNSDGSLTINFPGNTYPAIASTSLATSGSNTATLTVNLTAPQLSAIAQVGTNTTNITNLTTSVSANTAAINNTLTPGMNANALAIADLNAQMASTAAKPVASGLQTQVSANTAAISANTSAIAAVVATANAAVTQAQLAALQTQLNNLIAGTAKFTEINCTGDISAFVGSGEPEQDCIVTEPDPEPEQPNELFGISEQLPEPVKKRKWWQWR